MNRQLLFACAIAIASASLQARAAIVGTLAFDSSGTIVAVSAANSSITSGSYFGVTAVPGTSGSYSVVNSSGWSNGFPSNQYLDVTISANPGYTVTVDSVDLRGQAAATPFVGRGTYSLDGLNFNTFGSDLDLASSTLGNFSTFTQTVTSSAGGPIIFRLVVSTTSTATVLSIGNIPDVNTFVTVNGTVQLVPEPAMPLLGALGAGGVWLLGRSAAARRRRHVARRTPEYSRQGSNL